MRRLLAIGALVAALGGCASENYEDGLIAAEDGGEIDAVDRLRARAEAGDPEAQFQMGSAHRDGAGITQNYAEALRWFQQGRDQDHPDSLNALGELKERGWGTPRAIDEAAALYAEAARRGHVLAQVNLGRLYELGLGVERDYGEALTWYGIAAIPRLRR